MVPMVDDPSNISRSERTVHRKKHDSVSDMEHVKQTRHDLTPGRDETYQQHLRHKQP